MPGSPHVSSADPVQEPPVCVCCCREGPVCSVISSALAHSHRSEELLESLRGSNIKQGLPSLFEAESSPNL